MLFNQRFLKHLERLDMLEYHSDCKRSSSQNKTQRKDSRSKPLNYDDDPRFNNITFSRGSSRDDSGGSFGYGGSSRSSGRSRQGNSGRHNSGFGNSKDKPHFTFSIPRLIFAAALIAAGASGLRNGGNFLVAMIFFVIGAAAFFSTEPKEKAVAKKRKPTSNPNKLHFEPTGRRVFISVLLLILAFAGIKNGGHPLIVLALLVIAVAGLFSREQPNM